MEGCKVYKFNLNSILRRVSLLLAIVVLVLTNPEVTIADSVTSTVDIPSDYAAAVGAMVDSVSNSTKTKIMWVEYKNSGALLHFDNVAYNKLDKKQKESFMSDILSRLNSSSMGANAKNKVYNFVASQDPAVTSALKYLQTNTNADFVEAKNWFDPASKPISIALGVLSLLIFLFLGAGIVMDLSYMILPGMQLILERGESNKKPFGVSLEAWKATREAMDTNENTLSIYLKRRIPVIILVSIALGYLITGGFYDMIMYIVDAFS